MGQKLLDEVSETGMFLKSPHGWVYGVFSKELLAHNTDYRNPQAKIKIPPTQKLS